MKVRLNIPGLVLLALPGIPMFMFVIPPLLNARNTHANLLGLGLAGVVVLGWVVLGAKVVYRAVVRSTINKLLK